MHSASKTCSPTALSSSMSAFAPNKNPLGKKKKSREARAAKQHYARAQADVRCVAFKIEVASTNALNSYDATLDQGWFIVILKRSEIVRSHCVIHIHRFTSRESAGLKRRHLDKNFCTLRVVYHSLVIIRRIHFYSFGSYCSLLHLFPCYKVYFCWYLSSAFTVHGCTLSLCESNTESNSKVQTGKCAAGRARLHQSSVLPHCLCSCPRGSGSSSKVALHILFKRRISRESMRSYFPDSPVHDALISASALASEEATVQCLWPCVKET